MVTAQCSVHLGALFGLDMVAPAKKDDHQNQCGCTTDCLHYRIEKSIPDVGVKITLYSIRTQSMVLMGRGSVRY